MGPEWSLKSTENGVFVKWEAFREREIKVNLRGSWPGEFGETGSRAQNSEGAWLSATWKLELHQKE